MEKFGILLVLTATVMGCILNTLGYEDSSTNIPKSNGTQTMSLKNNFTINSELVKNFLEHFKNPDSLNLPLPIPDPLIMPERTYVVIGFTVFTNNVKAHGVSRIRVANFTSDIVEMKVHFGLRMPKLQLQGNYSYKDYFSKCCEGGFNVTLFNAYTDCNAKLEITPDGELEATEIDMDLISREKLIIDLENAGFIGFLMNNFGDSLFNAIKSYVFSMISNNIRNTMNDGLKQLKVMFPNSIAPLDLGIAEGRKFIKNSNFDPYYVPDYQYATSIYSLDIRQIVLTGISSVYRFGDVKLSMDNHIVNIIVNVETEELMGSCTWEASLAGILSKSGIASFTVEYVSIMTSVNQSLDIRNKPRILDLKVKLGNIQLRMDGAGMLDYVAESGVNVLPNMLRYQIIQAAEMPMKRKVQEVLDNTDIEQFVLEWLPTLDQQLNNRNFSVLEENFIEEDETIKTTDMEPEVVF